MIRNKPESTGVDHNYYEGFLNRYKTFIAITTCSHVILSNMNCSKIEDN
jgi:hypothetical protein